jgi:TATA-box binding protein (TBP) (component of TFIID and TFIIIB)
LVFTTGKIVVTGSKSEDEAKTAMKRFAKQLSRINTAIKPKNFLIQNVVCNAEVGFPVRLEGMAMAHTRYATVKYFFVVVFILILRRSVNFICVSSFVCFSMNPNCFLD